MQSTAKVGLFFIVAFLVLVSLTLSLDKITLFSNSNNNKYFAYFDQVAGLNRNSKVRSAGVPIGEVIDIELSEAKAKVTFSLDSKILVGSNAEVTLVSLGILGEKYIELTNEAAPKSYISVGSMIKSGKGSGLEELIAVITDVASDIKLVTETFSSERNKIDSIISNLEGLTSDLRVRLPKLSDEFSLAAKTINNFIKNNESEFGDSLKEIKILAKDFQSSANNLSQLTKKINEGQGTIGQLINTDETIKKLNQTMDTIESTLGGFGKMDLNLEMNGEYWTDRSDARNGLKIDLLPSDSYWYSLEVANTPDGKLTRNTTTTTTINPLTGLPQGVSTITSKLSSDKTTTLSAYFNRRVGPAVFSAGLFDGKGGAGVKFLMLDDKLSLGGLVYDFSKDNLINKNNPRVKLTGSYQFYRNYFLQAGVQDLSNKDYKTYFVGGGIRWTDNDLKKLLGLASAAR